MKRLISLVIVGIFALTFAPVAFADLDGDASSHVWVDVVPNVAVAVLDTQVDIGEIQTGDFSSTITFRVDANMEDVNLSALVTDLYKGDDPTDATVAPIVVNNAAGVVIAPTDANPTNGATNVAILAPGALFGDFTASQSSEINFESSQNGHFSQDVDVTVTWTQDDPEKPQGEYSGHVQFFCLLTP